MIAAKVRVDTSGATKKSKKIERGIQQEFYNVSKLASKMAAFFCQQYTLPAGTKSNDWPFQKMSQRITDDISTAYVTKDDANWEGKAFLMIEELKGKERADAWWWKFKTREFNPDASPNFNPDKPDAGMQYEVEFDTMRFPTGSGTKTASESKYLAYRKKNNYRIPRGKEDGRRVLGVTSSSARQNLINKRQRAKGLAKAGWKACFHSAGGTGLNAGEMGGVKRKWPSQISVPYSKFGKMSLGSTGLQYTSKGFRAILRNKVDYMDEAFPDHMRDIAAKWTNRYMKIIFEQRKKHVGKKTQK